MTTENKETIIDEQETVVAEIFARLMADANKLLREQQEAERDERARFLHDKSGGLPMDVFLVLAAIAVFGTGLFNMAAFYTAFGLLCAAIALKAGTYLYYNRIS